MQIQGPEPNAVVFEFTTITGKKIRRRFDIKDAPDEPEVPAWLTDVRMVRAGTARPTDPIRYTGKVLQGHEAEARRWLKLLLPGGK